MKDKYTFRREFTDMYGQVSTVEHTVEAETLDELVMTFLYFLNGCSYCYVKDMIYVKEDGQEISVTDWDSSIYGNGTPETAEDLDQMTLDLQEAARQLY